MAKLGGGVDLVLPLDQLVVQEVLKNDTITLFGLKLEKQMSSPW